MKGYEQFIEVFGNVTVLDVATFIIAVGVAVLLYRKVRDFFVAQHEAQKQQAEDLKEALAGVRKYPEYRQQSIEIQQMLQAEIAELRAQQHENSERLQANTEKLIEMEERRQKQRRNELRDTLLSNFRYYTNESSNPNKTWTRVESETFWALYDDYESEGGNGHMHTDVAPVMKLLTIVDE